MNDCPDIKKLLAAFSAGKLAPQDKARMDAHIRTCPDCARELAASADEGKVLKGLARVQATEDFLKKVHSRLERPRRAERRSRIWAGPNWIKIPLEVAAAAAAVFLIYAVAREEPALYRPPSAPSMKLALRQEEKAKAAQLPSTGFLARRMTREAATRHAGIFPSHLKIAYSQVPPEIPAQRAVLKAAAPASGETVSAAALDAGAPRSNTVITNVRELPGPNYDLRRIRKLVAEMGGKEIPRDRETAGDSGWTMEADFPAANYRLFMEEIGSLFEIEKPSPPSPPTGQETLRLRIEILPQR